MRYEIGPLEIRDNGGRLPRGSVVPMHKHDHPHVLFVMAGQVRLEGEKPDGAKFDKTLDGPCEVNIPEHVFHQITVVSEYADTRCVFSLFGPDGLIERPASQDVNG